MGGIGSGPAPGRESHPQQLPIHRRAALETGWPTHPAPILRLAVVTAWRSSRFYPRSH